MGRPRCAEREVRVGSVRVRMTFLWMSEPYLLLGYKLLEANADKPFSLLIAGLQVSVQMLYTMRTSPTSTGVRYVEFERGVILRVSKVSK